MADTKYVTREEVVAETARDLAFEIWRNSGKKNQALEDADDFLRLVAKCAYALSGTRRST